MLIFATILVSEMIQNKQLLYKQATTPFLADIHCIRIQSTFIISFKHWNCSHDKLFITMQHLTTFKINKISNMQDNQTLTLDVPSEQFLSI